LYYSSSNDIATIACIVLNIGTKSAVMIIQGITNKNKIRLWNNNNLIVVTILSSISSWSAQFFVMSPALMLGLNSM